MSDQYDSNFIRQMQGAARKRPTMEAPEAGAVVDPTKAIRAKQANLCDAVMMRVVELEQEAKRLTDIAKKLRAAVVANT